MHGILPGRDNCAFPATSLEPQSANQARKTASDYYCIEFHIFIFLIINALLFLLTESETFRIYPFGELCLPERFSPGNREDTLPSFIHEIDQVLPCPFRTALSLSKKSCSPAGAKFTLTGTHADPCPPPEVNEIVHVEVLDCIIDFAFRDLLAFAYKALFLNGFEFYT